MTGSEMAGRSGDDEVPLTHDSPEQFDELRERDRKALQEWIEESFEPSLDWTEDHSAELRYLFMRGRRGFYIYNGSFKGAMQAAGFEHKDADRNGSNWYFRARYIGTAR